MAGVTVLPRQITLIEGNATESSKEYTVVLTSKPTANVNLALSPSSVNAFTTDRQSVIFTPDNWNTAVTVIVSVVDDDIDENTVTGLQRLAVTSSDPVYQALPANSIDISIVVRDDDDRGITVTESVLTGLTVDEEGPTAATYTVVLTSQPTHTVTITPDIGANTDVTVLPAFLEFLPAMWDDAQIVTVTAVDDDSDEDDESLTITHSASSSDRKYSSSESNNPVTIENVAVMIMDNDDAGVEIVSSLTVDEGSTGRIAVKLTSAPSDIVAVALSTTSADFRVTGGATLFSITNWDTVQNVTVTPTDDSDGADEIGGTITVLVTSADTKYGGLHMSTIAVTVRDDDSPSLGIIGGSFGFNDFSEDGGEGSFTVGLSVQPTGGDVTVTITSNRTGVVTVDTDTVTTGDQNTLTFTDMTWSTPQTVTVTAVNDDIDNPLDRRIARLTLTPSGADYEGITPHTIAYRVRDDDTREVVVSDSEITIEEDDSGIYTIVLKSQPTADVTITVHDPDETPSSYVELDVESLIFTPENWATPQDGELSVDRDYVDDATVTETFTHSISGGDYGSVEVADIKVIVGNLDERGVRISDTSFSTISSLSILEGREGVYYILLRSKPSGPLTINIMSSDATIATVDPISFTIDPDVDDWQNEVILTVTAVNNDIDHPADQMVNILHTVGAGANDYAANNVTIRSLEVTVTDNNFANIVLSTETLTIAEGATGRYQVKLMTRPSSGEVVVNITDDHDELRADPAILRFNTSNWDDNQEVRLISDADQKDEDDEEATITHSIGVSSPQEYTDLTALPDVVVSLPDDGDRRGVIYAPSRFTLAEGAMEATPLSCVASPIREPASSPSRFQADRQRM